VRKLTCGGKLQTTQEEEKGRTGLLVVMRAVKEAVTIRGRFPEGRKRVVSLRAPPRIAKAGGENEQKRTRGSRGGGAVQWMEKGGGTARKTVGQGTERMPNLPLREACEKTQKKLLARKIDCGFRGPVRSSKEPRNLAHATK